MSLNPDAALDFLGFIEERHRVWVARQAGAPQPWTEDHIIASRKFTNVFRLLDPGSQFVITDLLEGDLEARDYLMRCFLYRHTGRIEAWRAFRADVGRYPLIEDLEDGTILEVWKAYRGRGRPGSGGNHRGNRRNPTTAFERPIFTSAYLVFPQSLVPGTDKLESIVDLARRLFADSDDVAHAVAGAGAREDAFRALRGNKGVGDFMAMQVLTDYGYGTDFHENEFVVPGPGARKGAAVLGLRAEDAIEWAFEVLNQTPNPPTIFGRYRPSRMDVQNCLCEFSKYDRYQSKPSRQDPYTPAHPGLQLAPKQPPYWNI